MEELASRCQKLGFSLYVQFRSDGCTELSLCHDSWVTDNLYQARALPTWSTWSDQALATSLKWANDWLDEWAWLKAKEEK